MGSQPGIEPGCTGSVESQEQTFKHQKQEGQTLKIKKLCEELSILPSLASFHCGGVKAWMKACSSEPGWEARVCPFSGSQFSPLSSILLAQDSEFP